MKGIVLAGGLGTRLWPASLPISKILLPIYDKPMIYYPISVLMTAGIKDILIITNVLDLDNFKKLLGDGSSLGVKFSYKVQEVPRGIADSFIIGEKFIGSDSVALVLGDNIFHGFDVKRLQEISKNPNGATIFGYQVRDPERFGVVQFDENRKVISLEEKPKNPKSNYAVTGLYFYDNDVIQYTKKLRPSWRGELEITDLNNLYLRDNKLNVEVLGRGFAWLDTGTHESLLQASNFVHSMEVITGAKIACVEEVAYKMGYINKKQLTEIAKTYKNNEYGEYLMNLN